MMKKEKAPRRWHGAKGKTDVGKHLVPIVTHVAHRRKRYRIRLRLRPIHGLILLGAMLCAYPMIEAGVGAVGAIPSAGILAGIMVLVGVIA